ncbi:hypothetical protein N7447_005891 [Penicillium robsamsonii]|uniref:uncharacterized protein n=1 Tax=Penicillium robsamsonii TaxID=1792511 RepID=UPI002548D35C|nr:uncharacterized protein N7447_005891 [Penicillium robsamsonii]KAJ5823551.1 hypothetical protein N7447_005891 [Penicillium robsamsonii]
MEGPTSTGETPQKKKQNACLRRILRKQGAEVPPVPPGTYDPDLPPKRKRTHRKPGRHTANKRKKISAAAAVPTDEGNESSTLDDSSAAGPADSRPHSPASGTVPSTVTSRPTVPSPTLVSPAVALTSPLAEKAAMIDDGRESENVVWDPVDPLGLFDELEGPLDWPSEGLF